jgi:hypothetical protein
VRISIPLLCLAFLAVSALASDRTDRSIANDPPSLTPEEVVDRQIADYNRRDIEAFMSHYAPDIRVYNHPNQLIMEGEEQMRRSYGAMFQRLSDLEATIRDRIVHDNFVIDHEEVVGLREGETVVVVVIYEVVEEKIRNVWFIR